MRKYFSIVDCRFCNPPNWAVLTVLFTMFLSMMEGYCQRASISLGGHVKNSSTGEALPFASIYVIGEKKGVTTNDYGYFSIFLVEGKHVLRVSYVGFETMETVVALPSDLSLEIVLTPNEKNLDEVVIREQRYHIQANPLTVKQLSLKQLESLPLVFGEQDLIKAIQLQPGVKTVGEGTSSMFVRGGNDDQNLILMDDMSLYNISHMMGFVSVFNPDAVKSIKFYKDVVPAKYGGRVSSVMDVSQNEGNRYRHELSGGFNVFGARVGVQGPLKKSTEASYLLSLRKSWLDMLLKSGEDLVPGYFDMNAKITVPLDGDRQLQIGTYVGRDYVEDGQGYENKWGNTGVSIKYQALLSPRLFSSYSLILSEYNNTTKVKIDKRDFLWETGVSDINFKADYEWNTTDWLEWKFGLSSIYHYFKPGKSNEEAVSIQNKEALESGVYAQAYVQLTETMNCTIGLRWSSFANMGKDKWYEPAISGDPIAHENSKGIYNVNQALEPRIQWSWSPAKLGTFELGYARNTQYVLLLKNEQLAYTSLESWLPVQPNIEPMKGHSYSIGWDSRLFNKLQLAVAGYYKEIQNQPDFISNARLLENPAVALDVRQGKGSAYGVESMVAKTTGALTFDLSYVWSRSLNDIAEIASVSYSTRQDIPHDVKVNISYRTQGRWQYAAFWTYNSGRPFTSPTGYASIGSRGIPIYGVRNGSRYPDYHRLDVSVMWHPKPSTKRFKSTWTFSVYNLYARANPMLYRFTFSDYNNIIIPKVDVYTFANFFPNLSYAFTF